MQTEVNKNTKIKFDKKQYQIANTAYTDEVKKYTEALIKVVYETSIWYKANIGEFYAHTGYNPFVYWSETFLNSFWGTAAGNVVSGLPVNKSGESVLDWAQRVSSEKAKIELSKEKSALTENILEEILKGENTKMKPKGVKFTHKSLIKYILPNLVRMSGPIGFFASLVVGTFIEAAVAGGLDVNIEATRKLVTEARKSVTKFTNSMEPFLKIARNKAIANGKAILKEIKGILNQGENFYNIEFLKSVTNTLKSERTKLKPLSPKDKGLFNEMLRSWALQNASSPSEPNLSSQGTWEESVKKLQKEKAPNQECGTIIHSRHWGDDLPEGMLSYYPDLFAHQTFGLWNKMGLDTYQAEEMIKYVQKISNYGNYPIYFHKLSKKQYNGIMDKYEKKQYKAVFDKSNIVNPKKLMHFLSQYRPNKYSKALFEINDTLKNIIINKDYKIEFILYLSYLNGTIFVENWEIKINFGNYKKDHFFINPKLAKGL